MRRFVAHAGTLSAHGRWVGSEAPAVISVRNAIRSVPSSITPTCPSLYFVHFSIGLHAVNVWQTHRTALGQLSLAISSWVGVTSIGKSWNVTGAPRDAVARYLWFCHRFAA